MIILPAIDLYEGKAVRLFKGDYNQMTIYDNNPSNIAKKFENTGIGLEDLISIGTIGLIKAINTFNTKCHVSEYGFFYFLNVYSIISNFSILYNS